MKEKIVFLCHFSSPMVRTRLSLKSYGFRKWLFEKLKRSGYKYHDFAIWVTDYIEEFKKRNDFEFHVVSPHKGMKTSTEEFCQDGIYYHFYKCDGNLVYDYMNAKYHYEEKNNFRNDRRLILRIIKDIAPDLVCLCGAENPYYSLGVTDIRDIPVYVILQTLLNDSERIKYNVSSSYRRDKELEIFAHAKYFSTSSAKAINVIRSVNKEAVILHSGFPTHRPIICDCEKDFDFMFFARSVSKNKGVEDYLKAISLVALEYPSICCGIIGSCEAAYKTHLERIIEELNIQKNVCFLGFFDTVDEAYQNVKRAKVLVLPSITASLNSTVREGMLMGIPVICYNNSVVEHINSENICLIAANKGEVNDLSHKMKSTIENAEFALKIGQNAFQYADANFSNSAIVNKMLNNCHLIIDNKV